MRASGAASSQPATTPAQTPPLVDPPSLGASVGAPPMMAPSGTPPLVAEFAAPEEPAGEPTRALDHIPPLRFVTRRPDYKAKKEPPILRRPAPKRRVYHFTVEEPPPVSLAEKKHVEKIQRQWRAHHEEEEERAREAATQMKAVIRLQAWGRMRVVRGRFLADHARRIQRVYRAFHSRAMVQRTMDKMSPEAGAMFHQIGRGS